MSKCQCHLFVSPLRSYEEMVARCGSSTAELRRTLEQVHISKDGWTRLYRCRECGRFWCEECPFSERHGGGPSCLYLVDVTDAEHWERSHRAITSQLRQTHEDASFFQSLGDEVGPELCRRTGCDRLRIRYSVLCRRHHFEMVKNREYGAP